MVSRVRNPIPVGKAVVGGSELRQSHGKAAAPSLMQIAGVFARYGNFTLGGGSATTAVIHGEIVEKRHWVDDPKFALSYALGGTEAPSVEIPAPTSEMPAPVEQVPTGQPVGAG